MKSTAKAVFKHCKSWKDDYSWIMHVYDEKKLELLPEQILDITARINVLKSQFNDTSTPLPALYASFKKRCAEFEEAEQECIEQQNHIKLAKDIEREHRESQLVDIFLDLTGESVDNATA